MDTPRKINGMQKFYSKIMHKIEDFPPKLKLTKALSVKEVKENDDSNKIENVSSGSKTVVTPQRPPRSNKRQRSASHEPPYENVMVTSFTGKDEIDSDVKSTSKTCNISLEDEIFEELEKVAHDEAKLNAVIQNFDKILLDYNQDRSISEAIEPTSKPMVINAKPKSSSHKVLGSSSSLPLSLPLSIAPSPSSSTGNKQKPTRNMSVFCPPPLQKAKTCSIIESKCILKKHVGITITPEPSRKKPASSHEDELDKYIQITKSLMNLHDLNELAKKLDKQETERLKRDAIQFSNHKTYKVEKQSSSNEIVKQQTPPIDFTAKVQVSHKNSSIHSSNSCNNISSAGIDQEKLPRIVTHMDSKIKEELPSCVATSSQGVTMTKTKSVCELSRNNSGSLSKIPVKAQQIQYKYYGPQTAIVKPLSVHSSRSSSYIDMASPITASTSLKANSVRNLSVPLKPLSHQVPTINVPMMSCIAQPKTGGIKKSIMKSAVSTSAINFNNKSPQNPKSLLSTSPNSKLRMKSAVSDLALNKTNIKRGTPVDASSKRTQLSSVPRSNEKRLSILKKAQDLKMGADEVDFAHISPRNVISDNSQTLISNNKRDFVLKSGKQTIKKSHTKINNAPIIVATVNNRTNILSNINNNQNTKTKPIPPKPRTRTILPVPNQTEVISTTKTAITQQKDKSIEEITPINNNNITDRAYQSDCSDDSGHISNEADDNVLLVVQKNTEQHAKSKSEFKMNSNVTKKTGRISEELLEKFEATKQVAAKILPANNSKLVKRNDKSIKRSNNEVCNKDTKLEVIKCNKNSVLIPDHQLMDVYLNNSADTEVLFRSGVLTQLEAKRDELLSDRIVQLQAYCRGHLARKRVSQRRVQELAVKCIQRNVRAFLQVRDWPWWRLLVRVSPLLAVNRTEEQLKIANDELQILRSKLDKMETERNALKTENQRIEAKLTDMTVELADEHSSANITSERLEAETSERLRLEKELEEQQKKYRNLQESSEKLEMELICAKSDLNGVLDEDDPDNEDNGGVYKIKYERVARELEFTKKRLQTQHEHDLEQLVGLKKQLEKKLADAYEEVEEQRQVVGQWKRKVQKMTNEMNDLRMLLEEQNSRNNLLEKRQRKFDVECQSLQDATRQEKLAKERLSREKDVLVAEKFQLEQTLSDTRLELDLKEEKLNALQRELEEMTFGGGTEEEVAQLKRSKLDLEKRYKEQEEELDEMAGQIQLLEQAKLRLEMSLEQMRKDSRREAQQRDDELEEIRGNSYKKIKALECQLESEHEERTLLLREKHELERRLNSLEDQDRADRAAEEAANQKLKRDLRKYKALLRDAQSQLERAKGDSAGKAIIRQLRNQLEDVESARTIAQKARQAAENELSECQSLLEESQRNRSEAEDRAAAAHRDRAELQAQLDENEEELAELMKKYSATVKQLNAEQGAITEYELRITELESEKSSLKEQIAELHTRLENIESMGDSSAHLQNKRLELRTKELESRLEFEQTTRARLEVQVNRHKEAVEKAQAEMSIMKAKEMTTQDALKKAQKSLRELREEFHTVSNRETEVMMKRKELEKRLETAEAEAATARSDLRLALQRITDLQQAMEEDGSPSESESESSDDSLSDLDVRLKTRTSSVLQNNTMKDANGIHSETTLIIREEKDSIPRHSLQNTGAHSSNGDSGAKLLNNGDSSFA